MKMINCVKCGEKNSSEDDFCKNCGNKLGIRGDFKKNTSLTFRIFIGIGILLFLIFLFYGCRSYSPEDVEKANCGKVSKGDAMNMCLDMAQQCGVYNWRQACDLVYENEKGGETLCRIAKEFAGHCK